MFKVTVSQARMRTLCLYDACLQCRFGDDEYWVEFKNEVIIEIIKADSIVIDICNQI